MTTFVVVTKRPRLSAAQKQAMREEMARPVGRPKAEKTAAQVQAMLDQCKRDAPKDARHILDIARPGMTPIAFANLVLAHEKRLGVIGGHEFIDNQPATPYARLMEANLILKRLGLSPIGNGQWGA